MYESTKSSKIPVWKPARRPVPCMCNTVRELGPALATAMTPDADWRLLVACVLADDFDGVLALAQRIGDCRGWAARRGCCVTAWGVQLAGGNLLHLALASGALRAATALAMACPELLTGRCAVGLPHGFDRAIGVAALTRAAFLATVEYHHALRRRCVKLIEGF
ncbi:MAG: hypothetical protein EBR51_05275 [Gammaproteobacteria bacterium]|nr:hypothetical protein [Gammaproteobacteria bacterium]